MLEKSASLYNSVLSLRLLFNLSAISTLTMHLLRTCRFCLQLLRPIYRRAFCIRACRKHRIFRWFSSTHPLRAGAQGLEPNLRVPFSTSQTVIAAPRIRMRRKRRSLHSVRGRELTADSTCDPGKLNAEYILDGRKIKVGSGDGAAAGKAWVDDLVSATAPPSCVLSC